MENIDLPLWEQQHKETNVAYAAFLTYRDMGSERTLREKLVARPVLQQVSRLDRRSRLATRSRRLSGSPKQAA